MSAEVATIEEMAELSFDAVECDDLMPTRAEWLDRAKGQFPTMYFAFVICGKSSDELVKNLVEAEDPDEFRQHMMSLGDCIEDLKTFHEGAVEVLSTAYMRILIAMSHVAVQQDAGEARP